MKPDARNHRAEPDYLRELVVRAELSQREAARRLGVGERVFRQWLTIGGCPYSVQFCLETLAGPEIDRRRSPERRDLDSGNT